MMRPLAPALLLTIVGVAVGACGGTTSAGGSVPAASAPSAAASTPVNVCTWFPKDKVQTALGSELHAGDTLADGQATASICQYAWYDAENTVSVEVHQGQFGLACSDGTPITDLPVPACERNGGDGLGLEIYPSGLHVSLHNGPDYNRQVSEALARIFLDAMKSA